MIRVCDAIMGTGKSKSAITYMNEHSEKKFVYITPYITEAARITEECPALDFQEPSDELRQFHKKKIEHTRALLAEGANIATTHAAFKSYTTDMVESIKKHGYTLIIDEAVDVFNETKFHAGDVQLMLDAGYIACHDGTFVKTEKEYTGRRFSDLYTAMKCNNLVPVENGRGGFQYYYWALPYNVLSAFDDVIVLTYLFACSEFKYFLDIYGMEFEYIGVEPYGDTWRFTTDTTYRPEYVAVVKQRVHILNDKKLNLVGNRKNALSESWLKRNKDERKRLKKNMYSVLRYHFSAQHDEIMWSTYKSCIEELKGRGYTDQHVEFNCKAKNCYKDRTKLAYCVNIYAHPRKKEFFANHGVEYDEDGYALSTMIQWIWRSAIRDGKEIWIYIPSRRMRELLVDWLEQISST